MRLGLFVLTLVLSWPTLAWAGAASVVITAQVLPVREVIVDSTGRIIEIDSNTRSPVDPTFYLSGDQSRPITPSPSELQQYQALTQSLNFDHFGVIYAAPKPPNTWFFARLPRA